MPNLRKKITGPKAKNQKIWNKAKKNTVFVIGNPEKLKLRSKDFKNYKPWHRKIYNKEETLNRKNKFLVEKLKTKKFGTIKQKNSQVVSFFYFKIIKLDFLNLKSEIR